MMLRRLLALLSMVPMLHLSVAAGSSACATHPAAAADLTRDAAGASHHVDHDVTAGARMADAGTPRASDAPPCESTTQQHCCEAVAPCTMHGLVSATSSDPAPAPEASARVGGAAPDAPASFASAPEPPPPKA